MVDNFSSFDEDETIVGGGETNTNIYDYPVDIITNNNFKINGNSPSNGSYTGSIILSTSDYTYNDSSGSSYMYYEYYFYIKKENDEQWTITKIEKDKQTYTINKYGTYDVCIVHVIEDSDSGDRIYKRSNIYTIGLEPMKATLEDFKIREDEDGNPVYKNGNDYFTKYLFNTSIISGIQVPFYEPLRGIHQTIFKDRNTREYINIPLAGDSPRFSYPSLSNPNTEEFRAFYTGQIPANNSYKNFKIKKEADCIRVVNYYTDETDAIATEVFEADGFNDGVLPNAILLVVQAAGGGGGAGSDTGYGGGGGGAGEFQIIYVDLTEIDLIQITLGEKGRGGRINASGSYESATNGANTIIKLDNIATITVCGGGAGQTDDYNYNVTTPSSPPGGLAGWSGEANSNIEIKKPNGKKYMLCRCKCGAGGDAGKIGFQRYNFYFDPITFQQRYPHGGGPSAGPGHKINPDTKSGGSTYDPSTPADRYRFSGGGGASMFSNGGNGQTGWQVDEQAQSGSYGSGGGGGVGSSSVSPGGDGGSAVFYLCY